MSLLQFMCHRRSIMVWTVGFSMGIFVLDLGMNHYMVKRQLFRMCCLKFIQAIYNYLKAPKELEMSKMIRSDLNRMSYDKYQRLFFQDKERIIPSEFERIVDDAYDAINSVFSWGLSSVLDVMVGMVSLLYVWSNIWRQGVLVIICYGIFWYYRQRHIEQELLSARKMMKEQLRRFTSQLHRTLSLMISYDKTAEDAIDITDRAMSTSNMYRLREKKSNHLNYGMIQSICQMILFSRDRQMDVSTFLLVMQLIWSVNGLLAFYNRYQQILSDWNTWVTYWDNKTLEPDLVQESLPLMWVVEPFVYHISSTVTIRCPMSLTFRRGDCVRIHGKTGSGKTQFMNVLLGKYRGMGFGQYRDEIVECYQSIRDKLLIGEYTVRDIMMGESDDTIIADLLRLVELSDRIPSSSYDEYMTGLSGGERMRLSLANRLYLARSKPILILDEPDQGLDNDTASRILRKILTEYSDKIIFCIIHIKDFVWSWTAEYQVVSGLVSN